MASDVAYVQHVCDQLRDVGAVSFKKMFGEYGLYVGSKIVALVCDNHLFLKPTEAGRERLGAPSEGAPYPAAKPHFVLDEHLDNRELLSAVFRVTEAALPDAEADEAEGLLNWGPTVRVQRRRSPERSESLVKQRLIF